MKCFRAPATPHDSSNIEMIFKHWKNLVTSIEIRSNKVDGGGVRDALVLFQV